MAPSYQLEAAVAAPTAAAIAGKDHEGALAAATTATHAHAAVASEAAGRLLSRAAAALRLSCQAFPDSYAAQMALGRLLHGVRALAAVAAAAAAVVVVVVVVVVAAAAVCVAAVRGGCVCVVLSEGYCRCRDDALVRSTVRAAARFLRCLVLPLTDPVCARVTTHCMRVVAAGRNRRAPTWRRLPGASKPLPTSRDGGPPLATAMARRQRRGSCSPSL